MTNRPFEPSTEAAMTEAIKVANPGRSRSITASASLARPKPLGSLLASAQRLTSKSMTRHQGSNARSWQEDAWEMYDLVGEERFLASTLAGRLSQARLFVGKVSPKQGEAPVPVDDPRLSGILEAIGTSAAARQQLINRLGVNLFVAGDGWLCGIPRHMFPQSLMPADSLINEGQIAGPPPDLTGETPLTMDITDLEWKMLSVSEVSTNSGGEVVLRLGEGEQEQIRCSPDEVFLIRVWRPHPRRWWEADSPTRSSLPVLRELVGLTMHISAQVDSRLAGAGLLIVPQSAQRALRVAAGLEDSDADNDDPFTEALMEAMIAPISDRSSASALVPLVVTVPDEATALFQYLTFAKPLDTEARNLRDEAIRRLALGQDAPPELLLGTAGMNHWGAWLVQEEVVTTHIEPPLALICDAITTQYLWPVLLDQGMTPEQAHDYVIWYDVSHMIMRPNRSNDAKDLHDKGVISDEALRDATGFEESDAPPSDSLTAALPVATQIAFEFLRSHPALAASPGLPVLIQQIEDALVRVPQPLPDGVDPTVSAPGGPPPVDTPSPTNTPAPPSAPTSDAGPSPIGNPTPSVTATHEPEPFDVGLVLT